MLTWAMAIENVNIKAVFIQNVSDAMASVGVIIVGSLILLFDWYVVDFIAKIMISAYNLYQGFTLIQNPIRILMDSAPVGFSTQKMTASMKALDSVRDVYHVHVRNLDEERNALEACSFIDDVSLADLEELKATIKQQLSDDYGIGFIMLEFELGRD